MFDHTTMPKQKSTFSTWGKKEHFLEACGKNVKRFSKRMEGHLFQPSGIFYAEGFAFLSACEMYDIDVILESGMSRGNSTEIWLKNFSGEVITCEFNRQPYHDDVERRLSKYENVEIHFGDSFSIFPKKIAELKNKRVAIFIDGPKDLGAINLAKASFEYNNVIFAGIHDVANPVTKCRGNYGFMNAFTQHILSTDEDEYRDLYGFLDETIVDPIGGAYVYNEHGISHESFEPDAIRKRFPKGPGIGIALNPHLG